MYEGLRQTMHESKQPGPSNNTRGNKRFNSKTSPKMIATSIVDEARNINTENSSVRISGIVHRNDNLNDKTLEVNQKLRKMCEETKLII